MTRRCQPVSFGLLKSKLTGLSDKMAKTAIVTIDGLISAEENWQGSIQWVRDQLEWQGQFDDIQVTINSFGGDCTEGLGIYDLLLSYNKPITTIAIAQCCSIATVIFCAGTTRFIHPNTTFMVHQTAGECWGNSEDIRVYADWMDAFNRKIQAIYEKTTGKAAEIVMGWMGKTDTFMTAEESVTNGFATAIVQPVQARAFVSKPLQNSPITNQSTMNIIKDQIARLYQSITNKLAAKPIKNEAVKLADGSSIDIATTDGTLAEGDAVTKDGVAVADGSYSLEDGTVITVKAGVIETIDTANTKAANESADPTASADKPKPADAPKTVTIPEAEYNELKANAALASQVPSIQASLARMGKLLGDRESGDVQTNAPRTPKAVGEKTVVEDQPKTAIERANERKEKEKAAKAAQ